MLDLMFMSCDERRFYSSLQLFIKNLMKGCFLYVTYAFDELLRNKIGNSIMGTHLISQHSPLRSRFYIFLLRLLMSYKSNSKKHHYVCLEIDQPIQLLMSLNLEGRSKAASLSLLQLLFAAVFYQRFPRAHYHLLYFRKIFRSIACAQYFTILWICHKYSEL